MIWIWILDFLITVTFSHPLNSSSFSLLIWNQRCLSWMVAPLVKIHNAYNIVFYYLVQLLLHKREKTLSIFLLIHYLEMHKAVLISCNIVSVRNAVLCQSHKRSPWETHVTHAVSFRGWKYFPRNHLCQSFTLWLMSGLVMHLVFKV